MAPVYTTVENNGSFTLLKDQDGFWYAQSKSNNIITQIFDMGQGSEGTKILNLWQVERVDGQNAVAFGSTSSSSIHIWTCGDSWTKLNSYNLPLAEAIQKFSVGNVQSYSIFSRPTPINEGAALVTRVTTTNVASGTTLYYSLSGSGITATDFSSGALTGSGIVGSDGTFTFTNTLANDLTTEGTETLNIKLFSDSSRSTQVGSTASVSIADTSAAITTIINNNSFTTINNITNTTTNNNYVYINSNNTINNTWNTVLIDNSVNIRDVISQWFPTSASISQSQALTDTKFFDISASTWEDKVKINSVARSAVQGGRIDAQQVDFSADPRQGSLLSGDKSSDEIRGKAGWDVLDGGAANDFIRAGNGRDIITGGLGADELHGDFGWNTYKSEKDGASDLIAIKSDHYLVNWLYGQAGNNPNGEKADIIEGLDSIDKIKIIGVDTRDITFAANVSAKGVTGIGIYGKGALEALYTGGDLTVAQITQMTSGDASAAAMSNSIDSYGVW